MSEQLRLLICHTCEVVEEVPWCGEALECGHRECVEPLEYVKSRHWFDPDHSHIVALAGVEKTTWDNWATRRQVLENIQQAVNPGHGSGMGTKYYDTRDNFHADAHACWKKHNRTLDCGDYKSHKMLLKPETRAERKDLHLEIKNRPGIHLCEFCPVKSIKQTKALSGKYGYTNPY